MDIGWSGVYVVVIGGGLFVTLGIILVLFRSAYRRVLKRKDRTIGVLREQIRIAKELDEAHEVAARIQHDASAIELRALALAAGRPSLLESHSSGTR